MGGGEDGQLQKHLEGGVWRLQFPDEVLSQARLRAGRWGHGNPVS